MPLYWANSTYDTNTRIYEIIDGKGKKKDDLTGLACPASSKNLPSLHKVKDDQLSSNICSEDTLSNIVNLLPLQMSLIVPEELCHRLTECR